MSRPFSARIYAKLGTHSGRVVTARKVSRRRCPKGVNCVKTPGIWFAPGDWLEIKNGAKWEGPLKLDEIREHGGSKGSDGLHVMHWI